MICYKDKTFCSSNVTHHTCGRKITEDELAHAERIGLPVSYSEYCV